PASDVTISMIEAVVVNGQVTTEYKDFPRIDLGQLPFGYFFTDFNTSSITINVDPSQPEPLTVKISFECSGPEEVQYTTFGVPGFDLVQFDVSFKLTFDVLRAPAAPPPACAGLKSVLDELATCIAENGGPDPYFHGRLEFLSWIDKIRDLRDDEFDSALKKYVVSHVVTTGDIINLDGTFQKAIRNGIYDKLKDPATRLALSSAISKWILGGTGLYDVLSCVNDGQRVTIKYFVPQGKLDPFPDSMFRPQGWPYLNNPNPDPSIDFSLQSNLSNIRHIVVLTMENRSFDHMLGYLSLPVSAGGMGRTDVDGLKGGEFNFYNGTNY